MRFENVFFVLAVLFLSCKRQSTADLSAHVEAKTELNVSYGAEPRQKMDIYLPKGRNASSTITVVMIHGGGWVGGDKSEFTPFIDTIRKRLPDWAVININYRLSDGSSNLFPTQERDVKSALEYLYRKRDEYGISDKFVLMGGSAGGHLALLHAYKYTTPVKVAAVVDFFGPTDLVDLYENPPSGLITQLALQAIGGTPAEKPDLYRESSPIHYVTSASPPTIVLQGGADELVPARQSEMLVNKLTEKGVVNQYVFYPEENHGWGAEKMGDSFDKITSFLKANVK